MDKASHIDTESVSLHLRAKGIDVNNKAILITNFLGSKQQEDLTEPPNCRGFGRIRHFKLQQGGNWPSNPLPILPASIALNQAYDNQIRAQVFQNAICNWRCWYCFVDYSLLKGSSKHASFLTCDEMLDMYLDQDDPPPMIDLTGGQPDLTPEWIPWMMDALRAKGLEEKIFLWSDDNLSNDFFWRYLTDKQIESIISYKKYSRVCCFKGIDEASFALNTKANPALFDNQFDLIYRLLRSGLDLYSYITLTAESNTDFESTIPRFFDKAQKVHENLPLRIVPLEVLEFTPVVNRMNAVFEDMKKGQYKAIQIWLRELQSRFSIEDREKPITQVNLK